MARGAPSVADRPWANRVAPVMWPRRGSNGPGLRSLSLRPFSVKTAYRAAEVPVTAMIPMMARTVRRAGVAVAGGAGFSAMMELIGIRGTFQCRDLGLTITIRDRVGGVEPAKPWSLVPCPSACACGGSSCAKTRMPIPSP